MKRTMVLFSLFGILLLAAAPAKGAEQFILNCHVCDHVDAVGKGLKPDAPYTLIIRDVATGQEVAGSPRRLTTDAQGAFSTSYPVSLRHHPTLSGTLYDASGNTVILAAHSRFTAPLKCGRVTSLPFTGAPTLPLLVAGLALLGLGGTMVARARRRPAH